MSTNEEVIKRFNVFGREITRKISDMHTCVDQRFEAVDQRFEVMDQRLGRIETDVAEIKNLLINGRG